MSDKNKDDFINKIPMAYAFHKMIFNDEGVAVDYEFIEVNDAFEKQTSLKRKNIIGKRVSQVIPNLFNEGFNWLKTYEEVVKFNKTLEFNEYAATLGRWYRVFTYSPEENCFVTIFFDISETVKKAEEQLSMYTMLNDVIIEISDEYTVENIVTPDEGKLFFPIKETLGKDLTKLLPEEYSEKLKTILKKARKTREMESMVYNSIFKTDKRWFQADVKFIIINKKSRYIISIRDITEKKMLEQKLDERKQMFKTIFDKAPVGIAVASGFKFISDINDEFMRILGRTKEEIAESNWAEFTHPDDLQADIENFNKFKSGEISNYSMIKRYLRKDGTTVWVNMMIGQLELDSEVKESNNHICIVKDITESVEAEKALEESERSKAVMLSHLPGMAYRCKMDKDWTMEFVSEGCYELTGYKPEQILNNKEISFNDLITYEYREYLWDKWNENLKKGITLKEEYQIVAADGSAKWVLEQGQGIYDKNNNVIALEGLIIDITDSKKREIKILYMNDHDALTDLYNRRYFFEEIKIQDQNNMLPFSIIVGNINGIRLINNAFGIKSGDKLIEETARIMRKNCRDSYVIARIGGDDFGILLPKTDFKEALEVMEKIRSECEGFSKIIKNQSLSINISLGCGTKTIDKENILDVYTVAQDYMYKNKLLDRKSSHGDILTAIMAALFAKSQETEQHAKRLSDISKMIGVKFNLLKHELDLLELLSMLHDIGKIGIEDRILNKPGKLTDEEWAIMKKHPEIGYKIAISSPELEPIAEFILTHHERWDGLGYPNGIKGDAIPLISRIVEVADAYDAMTEDRIYRKAISSEKAVKEINRCSGTQFDPEVVRVFNEIIANGEI